MLPVNEYSDLCGYQLATYSEQRRLLCHDWLVKTTFHVPNFEDKGRIHAYHNEIKVDFLRGNSTQAGLSEVATDGTRPKFRYNRLGLFIYRVGVQSPSPI